jgi:hypothetical protein
MPSQIEENFETIEKILKHRFGRKAGNYFVFYIKKIAIKK